MTWVNRHGEPWVNAHCSGTCFDARVHCPKCPDKATWLAWFNKVWLR